MKMGKRGFTLAEMLIVVAIIGILVAVVTPVLTKNLEKAREATDMANIRSACAILQNAVLDSSNVKKVTGGFLKSSNTKINSSVFKEYMKVYYTSASDNQDYPYGIVVELKQQTKKWQTPKTASKTYTIGSITVDTSNFSTSKKYLLITMNEQGEFGTPTLYKK